MGLLDLVIYNTSACNRRSPYELNDKLGLWYCFEILKFKIYLYDLCASLSVGLLLRYRGDQKKKYIQGKWGSVQKTMSAQKSFCRHIPAIACGCGVSFCVFGALIATLHGRCVRFIVCNISIRKVCCDQNFGCIATHALALGILKAGEDISIDFTRESFRFLSAISLGHNNMFWVSLVPLNDDKLEGQIIIIMKVWNFW